MSQNQNVRALKPEYEDFTDPSKVFEDDLHRPVVRVSSNPLNPTSRSESFRPAYQPTIVDGIKSTVERHKSAAKAAAAAAVVGGLVVGTPFALNARNEAKLKGDTGLEESILGNTELKPLKGETTRVVIRGGASVRTSPSVDEDKANGNKNVAFEVDNDKSYEITKGVHYKEWLGFQLPNAELGEHPSPADVAANTLWVNLDKLKQETRPDGTTYASEYPLEESVQEFEVSVGDDGHYHDEQQNTVAVANIVDAT